MIEIQLAQGTADIGQIMTGLGGGLAMFLFGMRVMTDGLKNCAGPGMKRLLSRLTRNRFTALLGGTVVTAVIQSSSVTTVLLVGFITAGLMTLKQSIGVIIGANIGTTITAQVIAFNVTHYGLALIAIGFLIEVCSKNERWKQSGDAIVGLGLIFFGMELMSGATTPLRSWPPFLELMQQMHHPMAGIAVGAVFTAVVQSSSATTGIVIVLASGGFISLDAGIALIFGSNIGTCVTALLSSFGKPREALQASVVHVVFNIVGVLLWVAFIPQFAEFTRTISPISSQPSVSAQESAQIPRQIANAHTVFNIVNALVFIWFTGPLARLAEWLVPVKPESIADEIKPRFLDDYFLEQPATALELVHKELLRLGDRVRGMLGKVLRVSTHGGLRDVELFRRLDDDVDALHGSIVAYLGRLLPQDLVAPQPQRVYEAIAIANYLENAADVMSTNIAEGVQRRLKLGASISESTEKLLQPVYSEVLLAFDNALAGLRDNDFDAALSAVNSKSNVNQLADHVCTHLAHRLAAREPYRVPLFQIETDIVENLKRINTLTRRIGRVVAGENTGADRDPEHVPEVPL